LISRDTDRRLRIERRFRGFPPPICIYLRSWIEWQKRCQKGKFTRQIRRWNWAKNKLKNTFDRSDL